MKFNTNNLLASAFLLGFISQACTKTPNSFNSQGNKAPEGNALRAHDGAPPEDATGIGSHGPEQPGDEANAYAADPCAGKTDDKKILVLDLKSGWFSGDGGDFFKKVTNTVCGGKIKVTYMHITNMYAQGNVKNDVVLNCGTGQGGMSMMDCASIKDFSDYSQFWLLTGDEADPADVKISSPLFGSIKENALNFKNKNPNAGFFFGAGLGNVQHANELAKHLFPEIAGTSTDKDHGLFAAKGAYRGYLPNNNMGKSKPSRFLTPGNGTDAGTFQANFPPFGLVGSFPALQKVFEYQNCVTDPVTPEGNGAEHKTVASDWCGNPTTMWFNVGNHKILAEGNTARFYGFEEYFSRAVLFLLQ